MADTVIGPTTNTGPVNDRPPGETAEERARLDALIRDMQAQARAFEMYSKRPTEALQKQLSRTNLAVNRSMLNDAPVLLPPDCSADVALTLLRQWNLNSQVNGIKSGVAIAKSNSERKERAMQEEIRRSQDTLQAIADSLKNAGATDALKWFMRVAMPTLGVLSIALTLGTATPLVAIAMTAMTTLSMAASISQEAGGPSLSVAEQLTGAIAQGLVEAGMSEQDARHAAMAIAGAVVVIAAVALKQSGGIGGLSTMANGARTAMQAANVAARAAAPLLVAADPKFIGNLAAAATYGVHKADAQVKGDQMNEQDEAQAAQVAAIVGTAVGVASQLLMGATMARSALSSTPLTLSDKAARAMQLGKTAQSALTATNGAAATANGAVSVDTINAEHVADQARLMQELAALIVKYLANQPLDDLSADSKRHGQKITEMLDQAAESNQALQARLARQPA